MWYMRLQPNLTLPPTPDPNQVRQEGRTSHVTLGSIALNELACPRLVFITPYTPPEKRTIKTRVTEKITKAVKDRHRLIFLDPITGTAVPCGADGQAPWPPPLPTLPASKPPRRPSSSLANACTLKPPAGPHSHITRAARTATTSGLRLTLIVSP